jgi:hypothetical protein
MRKVVRNEWDGTDALALVCHRPAKPLKAGDVWWGSPELAASRSFDQRGARWRRLVKTHDVSVSLAPLAVAL